LCETCHKKHHEGDIKLKIKRGTIFKDASFMGIMRWAFYNTLKEKYPNVKMTYGYITKNTRITNNLPKDHRTDALCITGNPTVIGLDTWYFYKKVRCQNRQIHKNTINKDGSRKLNQSPFVVLGFRLFDKVRYNEQECFVFGRRASGSFDIRLLDGTTVNAGVGYKKVKVLEQRKTILIERRRAIKRTCPPTSEARWFPCPKDHETRFVYDWYGVYYIPVRAVSCLRSRSNIPL
jgi:hypothetical protein